VGYHNNSEISTPYLDSLVATGIELERHYAYHMCSPSRSSIQSGRLPQHVNMHNADPVFANPDDPISGYAGVPTRMTTIPAKLKKAGYATHYTGKW